MDTKSTPTDACGAYAAAYAAHYAERNLPLALQLYRGLTVAHPGSAEAGYSENQIGNIVKAVVPKGELLDAHVQLGVAHLEHHAPCDSVPISDPALAVWQPASEITPV